MICDAVNLDTLDIVNTHKKKNAKSYRCGIFNMTNNNMCKHKTRSPYKINNKYACTLHYKLTCNKTAIVIQKIYKGYRSRQKINNIYKKLPTELQHMILFYVRQDYYYNRYTKTIGRIVQNKLTISLNNIINDLDNVMIFAYLDRLYNYLTKNNKDILHIIGMFIKYYAVIEKSIIIKNYCCNLQIKFINIINKLNNNLIDYDFHPNSEYLNHNNNNSRNNLRNELFDIIYNIKTILANCVYFQSGLQFII